MSERRQRQKERRYRKSRAHRRRQREKKVIQRDKRKQRQGWRQTEKVTNETGRDRGKEEKPVLGPTQPEPL